MPDDTEPISATPEAPTELHGLDPGELLARGLHTVKASANTSPWEPPTPEELARLLPQYHIESLLGRGGMGAVYKGVQVALERPVAIKLLPAEVAADQQFIGRFQREARTLAKLQHPGIVAVYDFGQTSEGHLYFVMEYVDGTDLQRVLKGPGLNPEQAFELIAQVCDALHYAHRQGVIHRDIKPANILLTKDGRAKVADFGLARPLTEDGGGLTVTNMVMGTPDYMAPEQRTGATHADHRADIFALGVMLYEMLTGQRPQGAFDPPSRRVQVDVRIDEVVLKALQQEPDRRYQQASEMKTDVDRIRTTPPAPVKKPKPGRIPPLAWLGAAAALAVIAWLGVRHFYTGGRLAASDHSVAIPSAAPVGASTPAPTNKPVDVKAVGQARKLLADARAQAKAGDAAEARKLVQQALDLAGTDLGVVGEAALVLADAQAPERAARLAGDFAKDAEAEHPLFAPVAELRVKLAPKLKQYDAHLAAATKLLAAHDDDGEQRELQAALEILPDGQAANERAPQNPLIARKPVRGRQFTNSLGQKFVPLPSQPHLLFCIWEARVKDFEAFVQETGYQILNKTISPPPGKPVTEPPYSWRNPGFPQTGDHPVVGVGREDAWAFCQWLTQKARAAGQITAGQVYRLPTDREWSAAMGVTGEAGDLPEFRKFPDGVYSWGKSWPPPPNVENFAGDERKEFGGHGPKDDWVWTAPVGSGKPNPFGIYDLCGNVRELCKDHSSLRGGSFTVRGMDYAFTPSNNIGSALRSLGGFGATVGFRCIIDLQTPERLPLAQKMEAAIDAYLARLPKPALEKRYMIGYTVNEEMVSLDLPGNLGRNSPTDDDLMVFADLPITHLYLPGGYVPNFTALHKMPLKALWLEPADCTSFDGLKGLPLEWFEAAATGKCSVSSLEPLRGMKLKGLILGNDRFKAITDLSPLQGQPLQILDVSGTSVADLSPVKAAPLEVLLTKVAAITDPACVAWWPKLRDIGSGGPSGGLAGRLYAPVRDALAKGDDKLALVHLDALEAIYDETPWFNAYRSNADGLRAAAIQHELNRWLGGDRTGFKEQLKVFQGHAYLLVRAPYNFDNAKEMAEMLGGHLVTVTSKEENEFIKEEILKKYSDSHFEVWLGLTGVPNKEEWKWVTGEPFGFQAWDRFNGNTSGVAGRGTQNNNANWHYGSNNGAVSGWVWWHGGALGTHPFIIEWETAEPVRPTP